MRVREWIGESDAARPPSNLPEVCEEYLRAPAIVLHLPRLLLVGFRRLGAARERPLGRPENPLDLAFELRAKCPRDPLAERLARLFRRGVVDRGRPVTLWHPGRGGLVGPGCRPPSFLPVQRPDHRARRLRA